MMDERFSELERKPDAKFLGAGVGNSDLSRDVSTCKMARPLLGDDSRVILATTPQKADIKIPSERDLQAALTAATSVRVTPWTDTSATRPLMERAPVGGALASRRAIDDIGVTVVRFA